MNEFIETAEGKFVAQVDCPHTHNRSCQHKCAKDCNADCK